MKNHNYAAQPEQQNAFTKKAQSACCNRAREKSRRNRTAVTFHTPQQASFLTQCKLNALILLMCNEMSSNYVIRGSLDISKRIFLKLCTRKVDY